MRTATNPQTGEQMYYDGQQWLPVKDTMSNRVQGAIKGRANEIKEFSFGEMVSNIPSSGAQYARDIASAVTSPIETAKGIGRAALGGIQHLIPGEQSYEPYGTAVAEHFGQRYGGVPEFQQTLMEDPVGVLGDVAGLAGGVGMLPKMGKVGQLGSMVDPANLAVRGIPAAVGQLTPAGGMYQSAAKMHSRFDAPRLTDIALENRIMPTEGGLNRAQSIVSDLADQVDVLIDQSGKTGKTIPVDSLLNPLQAMRQRVSQTVDPNMQADLAVIDNVIGGLQESAEATGKSTITVAEAQSLKRRLQGDINWGRTSPTADPTRLRVDKAMAQGVRESIEQVIPEIKDLNLRQKDLLDLMDALEVPASRIGRRDLIGIGTPMKGLLGAQLGDWPGAIAGMAIGVLDTPRIKSRMAIELNRIKKMDVSAAQKRVLAIEAIRNEAAMARAEEELNQPLPQGYGTGL